MTTPAWPLTPPSTAEDVWAAPYPDFVAMINQTNVMPGAYTSINTWALHSRMDERSTLLDVACTTGFTSRELASLTGCAAVGFDLSADAVAVAKYNHARSRPHLSLDYIRADGTTFVPNQRFTHIAVGAALGFFPDPDAMAERLVRFLHDGGYILASPYWSDIELPSDIVELRREVFGITSPLPTRCAAMVPFHGLRILHEEDHRPIQEPAADIDAYCVATVERACQQSQITAADVREAMVERLRGIKDATNRLRPHLRYSTLVASFDSAEYPRRYVELF
ncbi:class I SAM-dependent methyltransferase [Nocardiopsis dassonvillei]